MPIFEYRCRKCDLEFEALVRQTEKLSCPTCASQQLDKLLSAASARVGGHLPIASSCPPSDAPPCGPGCCRL